MLLTEKDAMLREEMDDLFLNKEVITNLMIMKFFDLESDEMLEKKVEVFKKLIDGVPESEIEGFYDILELYPKNDNPEIGFKYIWD